MVEMSRLAAAMPGADRVRIFELTETDIIHRAREGLIFAYPGLPRWVARMARRGRFDWALAGARQALRDIEKPVDMLTHESRAAFVMSTTLSQLGNLTDTEKGAVANAIVTAIRLGVKA